jgi:probable HAF family extracellular repeat protein
MRYIRTSLTTLALAVLALNTTASAQTITDLHQAGWVESTARKINNAGQVMGDAYFADGSALSFFWDGSTVHLIGPLGSDSIATDLNDSGQVVGSLFDGGQLKPFVFESGTLTILNNLGGSFGDALDINNAGQVTGYSRLAGDSVQHAFVYQAGNPGNVTLTDIDTLGTQVSTGLAINEAGQVMGHYLDGDGKNQVFRYSGGVMTPISSPAGSSAFAVEMNASGVIVGDLNSSGINHAFVASSGTAVDLGTLGGLNSFAVGINDSGVVIGNSATGGSPSTSGFSWNGGALVPLPFNARAVDINNLGDILADGMVAGTPTVFRFRGADVVTADLGGPFAIAIALNETGDFLGSDGTFGFRFDSAGVQTLSLGGSSSDVFDINDTGAVAGQGWNAANTELHAFVVAANAGPTDTTAPTTASATVPVSSNAAGWFNVDVTLNLSATDEAGGSGVKEIRYRVNGGPEIVVPGAAAAIPFSANGIYNVEFFAVDNAGNDEASTSVTINLDKSAAATTGSLSSSPNGAGWFNADVTLNLSAVDAGDSGVKEVRYSINGGADVVTPGVSTSKLFNSDGIFSVLFWSVDVADNIEAQKSVTVMLDKTVPSVSVSNVPFILEPPNNKMQSVTISGHISDNLSGIASASFWVHDEYGMVQPSGSVTVNADGSYGFTTSLEASRNGFDQDGRLYTIFVKGVDAAGNQKTAQSTVVVPH